MKLEEKADLEVFNRKYAPEEIVGRENQKQEIEKSLELFQQGIDRDLCIYGSPGTGKTLLAEKTAKEHKLPSAYVNCFDETTKHGMILRILRQLTTPINAFRAGMPTDKVVQKLQKHAENNRFIAVVDEVDKLETMDALYTLLEIDNCQVIAISDKNSLNSQTDERIKSRMSAMTKVEFLEYDVETLKQIIYNRHKEAVSGDPGDHLAGLVAELCPRDARIALSVMQECLVRTESRDREMVKEVIRDFGIRQEGLDRIDRNSLKEHEQVLLEIIEEEESIKSSDLYEEYEERVDEPKVGRTVRKYLKNLENYCLIEKKGGGRYTRYETKSKVKIKHAD